MTFGFKMESSSEYVFFLIYPCFHFLVFNFFNVKYPVAPTASGPLVCLQIIAQMVLLFQRVIPLSGLVSCSGNTLLYVPRKDT